ncbi:hypothetical protein DIPPA_22030 [Diplonema papillatum]|nr:hypothetical protein DIPPA_22030 [Diplonema papillatum]
MSSTVTLIVVDDSDDASGAPQVYITVVLMVLSFCIVFTLCWLREAHMSKKRWGAVQQQLLHDANMTEPNSMQSPALIPQEHPRTPSTEPELKHSGGMPDPQEAEVELEKIKDKELGALLDLLEDHSGGVQKEEAPADASIEQQIAYLLRSREAGEEQSPRARHDLARSGIKILDKNDVSLVEDLEQAVGVTESHLLALPPADRMALAGEWVTAAGLHIDVASDGSVRAADGNTALMVRLKVSKMDPGAIALRSGFRILLLRDRNLKGPAPSTLSWSDGTLWLRRTADTTPVVSPARPRGLVAGLRVDTDQGRGTLVCSYAHIDSIDYWHVRLDHSPTKEALFSCHVIRPLPWIHQDLVTQPEIALRPDAFETFEEDAVREIVKVQNNTEKSAEMWEREQLRKEAVDAALFDKHADFMKRRRIANRTSTSAVLPKKNVVHRPSVAQPEQVDLNVGV